MGFVWVALAAAGSLGVVLGLIARHHARGRMVFLYPSGRSVPESFNPLMWKRLAG